MTDKPLSSHIEPESNKKIVGELRNYPVLPVFKVKEFIQKLKKAINEIDNDCVLTIKGVKKLIELEISHLAGDDLIHSPSNARESKQAFESEISTDENSEGDNQSPHAFTKDSEDTPEDTSLQRTESSGVHSPQDVEGGNKKLANQSSPNSLEETPEAKCKTAVSSGTSCSKCGEKDKLIEMLKEGINDEIDNLREDVKKFEKRNVFLKKRDKDFQRVFEDDKVIFKEQIEEIRMLKKTTDNKGCANKKGAEEIATSGADGGSTPPPFITDKTDCTNKEKKQ